MTVKTDSLSILEQKSADNNRRNIQVNKRIAFDYKITRNDRRNYKNHVERHFVDNKLDIEIYKAYHRDQSLPKPDSYDRYFADTGDIEKDGRYKHYFSPPNVVEALQGKEKLQYLICINNKTKFWETVSVDQAGLAKLIQDGYSTRGSVLVGGNGNDHVQYVSYLYFDIDKGFTIADTLDSPFVGHASIIYKSPSYTEENQKHRICFRLDRDATHDEAKRILLFMLSQAYPDSDKACKNLGRGYFGSLYEPMLLNPDACLKVDEMLSMIGEPEENKESLLPTKKESKPRDQFFINVDRFVYEEIFIKICGGDINKFCVYYNHGYVPHANRKGHIKDWQGAAFGGSGTRNWVFQAEKDEYPLPVFVDLKRDGKEYSWVHYALEGAIYNGLVPEGTTHMGADFDKVVSLFFEKHGLAYNRADFLPDRNLEQEELEKLYQNLYDRCWKYFLEESPKYFKRCIFDADRSTYFYYNFGDGLWCLSKSMDCGVLPECIYPLLDENVIQPFCVEQDFYVDYLAFIEYKDVKKRGVLQRALLQSLKKRRIYPSIKQLVSFTESRNIEVIPLANGDYNWRTQTFTPGFNPFINNQSRYSSIFDSNYDGEGIKEFDDWLNAMYDHEDVRSLIKSWIVLNIAGMAFKTQAMVNFYGEVQTGKSTVLNILGGILGDDLSYRTQSQKIDPEKSKFNFQSIEGKYALLIDEFNHPTESLWNDLKLISGNDFQLKIDIEHKGVKPYNNIFFGGITTVSQDNFKIPIADDGGIERRLCLIHHPENKKDKAIKALSDKVLDYRVFSGFFQWCLRQNPEEHLKNFIDIADNSEYFKDTKKSVLIENNPIHEFAEDCIEYTNDEQNRVSKVQLYEVYLKWLESTKGYSITDNLRNKFRGMPVKFVNICKSKYPQWILNPRKKGKTTVSIRIKGNKDPIDGYKGIKITWTEHDVKSVLDPDYDAQIENF